MDWSKVCPTKEQVDKFFMELGLLIDTIEYDKAYPMVQVLTTCGQLWTWDKWHGGGYWRQTDGFL